MAGLSKEAETWNSFIDEVASLEENELTSEQKDVVIAFRYDCEINSGGHSGFLDCYPNLSADVVIHSLRTIGNDEYAENFIKAIKNGKSNDYSEADNKYYSMKPPLSDLIQKQVLLNADTILSKSIEKV